MKTGLILLSALILNLINFNYTMRLTHYQNNKLKSSKFPKELSLNLKVVVDYVGKVEDRKI